MANLRIMVTGGAGFIGSHLCERLLRDQYRVAIVDNLDDFYPVTWKRNNLAEVARLGRCEFHRVDIRHADAVGRTIAMVRPDCIVHLAGYAGVRPSILRPSDYEHVNVAGTLNLLEAARQCGVRKFVFGSSSSVYGNGKRAPFRENDVEHRPISPYAATKLSGEMLAYTYAHLFNISTVCLRFFTVYGPRQRPDLAIHKFTAMMEAGLPIPVFGDGSMGRDYTYVDDIVSGIRSAMDYEPPMQDGAKFDIFNLGNSNPVSLNELIANLEAVTGNKAIRDSKPLQPGDVALTWADVSKSERLLGYKPATSFRTGLTEFVRWYRAMSPSLRLSFPQTATSIAS